MMSISPSCAGLLPSRGYSASSTDCCGAMDWMGGEIVKECLAGYAYINFLIGGAFLMGLVMACVIFLRVWRDTKIEFYGLFGLAFFILFLQRISYFIFDRSLEGNPLVYCIRLVAHLVIIYAIVRHNRISRAKN